MIWLLLFILCLPSVTWGQNHQTFQIARPVAVGTAGTGLDADNRIYRAYSGLTYTIHADAVGGSWPYTYSLSNAPAGMTIEAGPCTTIGTSCTAGTITWTNPTSTASNIVVRITDKDGDWVEGTWSITVSTTIGADGFCFLNATSGNDTTGSGSLAAPYQTIAKAHASCGARSIIYFRAGTYTIDPSIEDGTNPGDCDRRVLWPETSRGVIWLAYPGETPIIDFESVSDAQPCFQMQGENIWIDGLELQNVGSIAFKFNIRTSGFGAVVRNVNAHDLLFGGDGKNSSFFLWTRCDDCPTWFDTVQNSTFDNIGSGACALKLYGIREGLFETSAYSDSIDGEAVIAIKGTVPRYTVRANSFASTVLTSIGGNMDTASPCTGTCATTGGEIYHNLILGTGTTTNQGGITLTAAKVSAPATTWVYRNTVIGKVLFANGVTGDGPYNYNDNVIVNAGGTGGSCPGRLTCESVTDYTVTVYDADNVDGANDGTIANATTGALVGASRTTYLGVAGFELATVTITSTISGSRSFFGSVRIR